MDNIVSRTEVYALNAPLIQPFRTALGDHNSLENFIFALYLNGKESYFGEAAVATHITGETKEGTYNCLKQAGNWLKGKDVTDYINISKGLHEQFKAYPSVIAAVETALFDALTSVENRPLWSQFGETCRKLQADITIVVADLKETEDSVKKFYDAGFRQFKVKVGRDPDLDIQRLAVVDQCSPDGEIVIDANQGFSAQTMLKFLKALKQLKISPVLLEQPVHRDDFEGLIAVSRQTEIPVCADESARNVEDAKKIIKHKAADVINIKLMKTAIVESLEIIKLSRQAGIKLMIGGMLESSIAMTASAHIAAGSGAFSFIDLDTPFFIKDEVERNPYLSPNGVYDLSAVKRGIGITPLIKAPL